MTRPQIQRLLALVLVVTVSIGLIHPFSSVMAQPAISKDPNLKVELVAQGSQPSTSMALLGPNDILVLEKETGTGTENYRWQSASAAPTSSSCFTNK